MNHETALRTTTHLFLSIGFVATVSFILSAHWLLILAALPVCAFAWYVLYKFEEGLEKRSSVTAFTEKPIEHPNSKMPVLPLTGNEWQPGLKSGTAWKR